MEYYLCVLDFEATCWQENKPKKITEIIEFPSVLYKVNEDQLTFEFIDEFAEYVRPVFHPELSDFCKELTGITQEQVNGADIFENVYQRHQQWLTKHIPTDAPFIIATCGHWDLRIQLPRELKHKKIPKCPFYETYINVKDEFRIFYKRTCGGMTSMLDDLNIKLEGRHHSGIDDSRNTAKIMIQMIKDGHKYKDFSFRNYRG